MNNFKMFNEMIMDLNRLAKIQKQKGCHVIDATLGMLYDDHNQLMEIKTISDKLKEQINYCSKVYDSFIGSESFNKNIIKWLFKGQELGCYVGCGYTMGATGALSFCFSNYCRGGIILVPSIRWSNYDCILDYYKVNKLEYVFFNNDKFNILNFKDVMQKQNNDISILINDPCHNPTGYTLEEKEWEEILNFLYEQSFQKRINVILDLAYIDYTSSNFISVLKKISYIVNKNLSFFLCFSFSKSFGLYGYRGGVVVSLVNTDYELELFYKQLKNFARSTWSSPNHLLTNTFELLLSNNKVIDDIRKTINSYIELLNIRRNMFVEESVKCGLELFPNKEGFFVLVKTYNPISLTKLLIKDNLFVVPFPQGVRIAISSLSINDVCIVPKLIKNRVDELKFSKISDLN